MKILTPSVLKPQTFTVVNSSRKTTGKKDSFFKSVLRKSVNKNKKREKKA